MGAQGEGVKDINLKFHSILQICDENCGGYNFELSCRKEYNCPTTKQSLDGNANSYCLHVAFSCYFMLLCI